MTKQTKQVDARALDVLEFWFGAVPPVGAPMARKWFTKDSAFDEEIRSRFGALAESAARGELDAWAPETGNSSPREALALVVLLDQFSRNLYRGSARSFGQDPAALRVSTKTTELGIDRELEFIERYVLLMPLMHSEAVADQRQCVASFDALVKEAEAAGEGEELVGLLKNALDYAERHARVVERFGRFPHRNELLGRESTSEETEFLKEPGSSF